MADPQVSASVFSQINKSVFNTGVGEVKKIVDPYIGGYSFIKFYVSDEFNRTIDLIGLDAEFLESLERTFKEVSGMPDIELGTTSISGGFTQNEHLYPSEISKNMTEVNLKFQELSGSPYTKEFEKWVRAIRNPETGLSVLPNRGMKHYTVSMLYMATSASIGSYDEGVRKQSLEFASLLTCMFPKKISYSKYDFSSGDHSTQEIEQSFACNFHTGEKIRTIAKEYLGSVEFYNKIQIASNNIYDFMGGGDSDTTLKNATLDIYEKTANVVYASTDTLPANIKEAGVTDAIYEPLDLTDYSKPAT